MFRIPQTHQRRIKRIPRHPPEVLRCSRKAFHNMQAYNLDQRRYKWPFSCHTGAMCSRCRRHRLTTTNQPTDGQLFKMKQEIEPPVRSSSKISWATFFDHSETTSLSGEEMPGSNKYVGSSSCCCCSRCFEGEVSNAQFSANAEAVKCKSCFSL